MANEVFETRCKARPVRLRPILMTSIAMIAGMMPTAMKLLTGSEGRAPMAVAVIGGLVTSTLLTLIVVPVVYTLVDDGVNTVRRWMGKPPADAHGMNNDGHHDRGTGLLADLPGPLGETV
jgi:HAE1 family hydrophobic/amphiphilic exporter-1